MPGWITVDTPITPERKAAFDAWIACTCQPLRAGGHAVWRDPDAAWRLIRLWESGLSTADMARKMQTTKNAVVGLIHRMQEKGCPMTDRPSPIRTGGDQPRRMKPSTRSITEAARIANDVLQVSVAPPRSSKGGLPVAPTVPSATRHKITALPAEPSRPKGRVIECQWPIGEPGVRGFRFCDAPSLPGKSYCGHHAKLAFEPPRGPYSDRQMASAAGLDHL